MSNSPRHFDQSGWARRADVRLRADYPNLITRIFEVTLNNFLITFDHTLQRADHIDVEEIRPVTLQLKLANEMPRTYIRELPSIVDSELALDYAGFPFTNNQLSNLVIGRFPDLPIAAIYDGGEPMKITVELTFEITIEERVELLSFCDGLAVPVPFQIVVSGGSTEGAQAKPSKPNQIIGDSDVLSVGAYKLRPSAPAFVRTDEAYWFDNLDDIYAGRLTFDRMPGVTEGDARCYLDATIGNHINFRQLLAYYDVLYFSPPLREGFETFLAEQALTEADLLQLIESGRLRILQTQPEERLSIRFLEAAVERVPDAVIGRRTAAAMLVADFVKTASSYRLNSPVNFPVVGELARVLAKQSTRLTDKSVLHQLLWPLEVLRDAPSTLFNGATKGVLPVGIGRLTSDTIKIASGKDIEFEAMMLSEKVHIAHAINATCFPSQEEPPNWTAFSNLMGDALNFYRSFNTDIFAAWTGNIERKEQGKRVLPPLDILAFDADVPIRDILEETGRASMRNRGRGLFSRLAELDDAKRETEIREISAALRKFGKPTGIMTLDNADTALTLAATAWGFVWLPVLGVAKLGAQLAELASRHPAIDRMVEQIKIDCFPDSIENRELDFLSRISRVATLKRHTVS